MIELKPLRRMMNEYKMLLEKYESNLEKFSIVDYKKLIGEVKMFWYRNHQCVEYFLTNITEDDKVAFLAGAVRLDIANNGHVEYILVGKCRLIGDPMMKMATFYRGTDQEINFEYANKYLKECIQDMLVLLRNYSDDFYVLPIEFINSTESNEYHSALVEAAERIILSMFSKDYQNVQEFYDDNECYEDIEAKLLPHIKDMLIFEELKDVKLTLRDRCNKYIKANGDTMPFMRTLCEAEMFYMLVSQYCMQVFAIIVEMKNYHMIPFIRNDVTFQYFTMIFHSNIMSEFSRRDYLNTYIPYVVQKAFDFSDKGYLFVKDIIGNGKMIDSIVNSFDDENIPLPNDIVECVEAYMSFNG
jgi:hypothetical protein